MRVKLARWGNSVAVRIPKDALETAGLTSGQVLDVAAQPGPIEFRSAVPRYTLDELVAEMQRLGPEYEPDLVDWGPHVGAEILPPDEYTLLHDELEKPDAN